MDRFLVRFGEFRREAEQIVKNACDAPLRTMEFYTQLVQLYTEKVGAVGVEDCLNALMSAAQIRGAQTFMPVVDVQHGNVNDVDSAMSIESSVAAGVTNLGNGAGSGDSMSTSIVGSSTTSMSVDDLGLNRGYIGAGRTDGTLDTRNALPNAAHRGSHAGSMQQSMDTKGATTNDASEDLDREK